MPGDPLYALEKLENAVHALSTTRGTIKTRLESAFIALHSADADDFPEELQRDYQRLESDLTSVEPSGGEGALKATLAQMDDHAATQVAERIVQLRGQLRYALDRRSNPS